MDGILINLDDINLPTEGKAWKTMVHHVLYHIDCDELMSQIDDDMIKEYIRDEGWQISDLFDDDEVVDYINEAGIPPQHVFDKEYIIGCLEVEDLEGLVKRNLPAVLMECPLIKNQQAKIAELEKKLAEANKALECLGIATGELECCGGTGRWGRGGGSTWECQGCPDCEPAEVVSEEE